MPLENYSASRIQALLRARNVRENILPNIMIEDEATNLIIKKVRVPELLSLVKILKTEGGYTGKTTGLKKVDLVNILKSVNYDFSELANIVRPKIARRTKPVIETVPYKKYGSLKKAVQRYEKSGNKQLEKAIRAEQKMKKAEEKMKKAEEKQALKQAKNMLKPYKPKTITVNKVKQVVETVPYRPYGSIKKAVEKYNKSGNKQLEKAVLEEKKRLNKPLTYAQVLSAPPPPKKRGRPRKINV